ncbi:large proline-rich protein bag6-like [Dorcoceras hygrometricum]|uniref:Large proline-rich protein bag6-like n=1 Tax=Dorcoceras hygrometricum TaxID=472368 RepID=A0A2Z7A8C5_9LAMI|nr:large proline-rich protein bag6-like [Dorcoceras hygrometricum]
MASSYYTNTLHVSFESVLAMDNPGMGSMFKALTASGLQGFLGCPAIIYEAALIHFFENALVWDVEGLTNLSEIPKDLVFDAKSIVSLTGEPVSMSGKKKEMKIEFRLLCDIMAKTISPVVAGVEGEQAETAADSATVETIVESVAEPVSEPAVADVSNEPSTTDDVDDIIQKADRLVETASDTEDEMDSDMGNQVLQVVGGTDVVLGTNVGVQTEASPDEHLVKKSMEAVEEKMISTDEAMSLEDILMSIPVDVPLPSASVEVKKINLGKSIKIPGVDERTCLKRLENLKIDDSYYAKEELVLSWAEAESTGVALQRRMYILLKYRELLLRKFLEARKINFSTGDGSSAADLKIMDWLSDLHLFVLEELKEQSLVHGLRWDKTCCSKIFEGRNCDRGAVIARSNMKTKSSCWIRTMLRVDGTWVIEPWADYWKPIPREVTSSMVVIPSRLSYVDTLPPMSEFFKLLKKRWGDVCINVGKFFASRKLLPVGSVNFCRSLAIVEPVSSFVSRQPTLFSLRLSQFCTVFVHYILFSGLNAADISSFVSTIAMDKTVLRNLQIAQNSVSVAPSVQLIDERPSFASTLEDSSMNFDETDTLSELVAYVNRGGNDKKGEDSSSRGPQPPPDDQDRPTGEGSANREAGIRGGVDRNRGGSGSSGSQSRGNKSETTKIRRSGDDSPVRGVRFGPYPPTGVPKRSAKHWITGERDF